MRYSEGCVFFVIWTHLFLVIPRKAVHEGHSFETTHVVYYNIHNREWKHIFWHASFRYLKSMHTRTFTFFFMYGTKLANHLGCYFSRMNL